ncbi:oxidoreductase [Mycobacterium sp. CBMA271]|uniref:PDR/VanB family oxidoreductase n=1 Tax=unclassified Mycobacteroides TaxID=2618759 RepID=UPI0012DFA447|nr:MULTISPECIES: PDR/VanB family oxidoreductase [unclassified Mycobacteroides]MUM17872.1 ferredoxin [Mycobacteroides sp. CBMA 326]MUM20442.1 oxidoreductase [Mycobacteroides sp. CBMA 271]
MSTPLGLKDVPADLYGKRKHERALTLMAAVAPRLPWLAGLGVRGRELGSPTVDAQQLIVRAMALVAVDDDVVSLHLRAPDNTPLPRWWPGAHLQVQLPSGLLRHYSLCGDPADTRSYRIAVRRVPGGAGSAEIHERLAPGATITVAGPRNAFPLIAANHPAAHGSNGGSTQSRSIRFVAGGIGITPILPMLDYAEQREIRWSLIYAGRSRESMPFLNELERFGDRVTIHCDDVDGPPTPAQLAGEIEEADALYCCGPPSMIHTMAELLTDYPTIEFHFERFGTPPIIDGKAFDVELFRGGEVLHIPAHRSVLDVVREARPNVRYACKQGFCGTCLTRTLVGNVEHRDHRLTPAQRQHGEMLICVSRATGDRLILDL